MERTEIMSICSRYGFNFIDVEDDEIVCCRDGLFYRISRNRFPGRLLSSGRQETLSSRLECGPCLYRDGSECALWGVKLDSHLAGFYRCAQCRVNGGKLDENGEACE